MRRLLALDLSGQRSGVATNTGDGVRSTVVEGSPAVVVCTALAR